MLWKQAKLFHRAGSKPGCTGGGVGMRGTPARLNLQGRGDRAWPDEEGESRRPPFPPPPPGTQGAPHSQPYFPYGETQASIWKAICRRLHPGAGGPV